MEATRNLVSSSPSFQTKTHLKSSYSSPSSVVMLHDQTTTPVVNSRHLNSLSRHFPASVLSQEPREESRPLSHALRDDRTSQLTLERRQFDELVSSREDEKFEQQLLHSTGLWNLLISPLTSETKLPAVVSPLADAELCDVVALAQKALSASKQAALLVDDTEANPSDNIKDSLSTSSSMSLPEKGNIVRSKRQLERRAKNRRAPKSNDVDDEGYVPQKTSAKKKYKQGADNDDALQLFLWGPETKQLLTAKEEAELISHIQHLLKLEKVKTKLESQNGCEPTIGEWAEAMGISSPVLKSDIHRGRSSREKLITANLRLVVHIAKQYQNRGLNFQDLLQEGSMGLMKSVEKFKPQSGCRFATYAYWWIRQSIRKSIFQNSRTIRLPENVYMLLGKVSEARKTCVQEGNYRPSKEELAGHVGVSTEKLDKLLYNTRTPLSMQQPIWSDQDTTFQEITPDSGIETPTMSVGKQLMRNHVRNLLNVLSPKERRIIKLRFGIDGGKQRSLSEIGEIYGLSKERVRQLESRALYRLKQNMNSHGLHAYADLLV
ncbi:RNA polymerase sigma-70 region 3 [Arabidopsis suecica]|uniref:RNA polymerase sigma factor sigF, chloroplastic n=2 Tax=Arabidopsis TaxID=3701 RepID=SIGF_ARATH|nr:RNApolymerase sigma-subunit F [Arabidopsis thaliana]Q9LD95.1 RecName: Full=RNA polymerase sigma factor sigF, chloroplastic; Short=Sigma factor F; Short=Sigma-F; AltName: Full=Protein SINGLET OXYGEN-LINKED DEATH ACTIVATOR 8; AltName: Full=RNA polymerase sigma factor sig6; Short=Atsig6; Short=Sigma factor 6; Flags: Precursor [Arabidopsis thaliana]KAG7643381.1 RNA polymerase sigma-70 region 3 [Arabidopsis suecica]AAD31584.2 putative RNA polymerase sigma-70 factor [Arabidopsis thaliana]AAL24116.|eukprot:NP_565856.1 RNApolymerase sigma-subunit F [Arabidopsis thaliana]